MEIFIETPDHDQALSPGGSTSTAAGAAQAIFIVYQNSAGVHLGNAVKSFVNVWLCMNVHKEPV